MYSIPRSCQAAARRPSSICAYANGSRRAFSRSCARSRGALPVFLEPSSPELSSLLSTFNAKILLPHHLTKEQQKLVYVRENKAKLDAEPVEITLGDVTLPLEHLDRNHLPNRWQQLREIVRQSETREDWENVVRLLEGFENAGIHVPPQRQELVIRKLNSNGMQHLVLKALQRPTATGVRLSNRGVLLQVLKGVHDQAALADWEKEETTKAYRLAKQIVELMDDEAHHGTQTRGEMVSEGDWRSQPVTIALPTELAAVLAERHGGNVEDVKKFANRLVNALKQEEYTSELDAIAQRSAHTPADFSNKPKQMNAVTTQSHDLLQVVIVWNALKTSRKVLGADMPLAADAQQFETRAEQVISEGLQGLGKLMTKDGKDMVNHGFDYIKQALKQCQL